MGEPGEMEDNNLVFLYVSKLLSMGKSLQMIVM